MLARGIQSWKVQLPIYCPSFVPVGCSPGSPDSAARVLIFELLGGFTGLERPAQRLGAVHGHEKIPTCGQLEVPARGQVEVPTPL